MTEKKSYPRHDRDLVRELYRLYDGDAARVARETGVSTRTVSRDTFDLRGNHGVNRVDPSLLARAKELLDEKSGYSEASATTGLDKKTLNRHFPGMQLSPSEASARALQTKKLLNLRVY